MWSKVKQVIWHSRGIWITSPAIALVVILLRLTTALEFWELTVFDQYMRFRPEEPQDKRIAIVGINEQDLHNIGQAIIPDRVYAQLLTKLKAQQPRAIGLDIYRDLPVDPGHQELVKVFNSTPNLVGIQKLIGDSTTQTVSPPPALKALGQVGSNDLLPDRDQKIRRALLSVKFQEQQIPSLALLLALNYLKPEGIDPQFIPNTQKLQFGKTILSPLESNDGSYIRIDAADYQIWLNYRGEVNSFEVVSLTDVLKDKLPQDWARDRIILIGAVSESSSDLFPTPYTLTPNQLMPGVEIHANITSQLISAALDGRPLFFTWSESREDLWILLWATIGSIIAWNTRYQNGSQSFSPIKVFLIIGAGASLIGITYIAFLNHWWLPVIPPFLALAGATIAITGYIAQTAGSIRNTFGRYLSDEIVATLLESPSGLKLGGERRKITIFTSDLRGFTATSERITPEEVVKILNFYLGDMAEIITRYQGTIDEFMGDGILVLFGAPIARADDAARAIACGLEMQQALIRVNQQMTAWGLPPLDMGIGINTGEVVVGNIGSEKRTKYGIVGSQVNLTYRIESYTIGGQIFISESTLKEAEATGAKVMIRDTRQVSPKGVKEPITIYDIEGINSIYNLKLPEETEQFSDLESVIPIQYSILEGKDIIDTIVKATIIKLSDKGAIVYLNNADQEQPPLSLTNLKINLLAPESSALREDIYAKVLGKPDLTEFRIRFTARPPAIQAYLSSLIH